MAQIRVKAPAKSICLILSLNGMFVSFLTGSEKKKNTEMIAMAPMGRLM